MPSTTTLYLLLVLSQNGAGDIHASFVNSATLSDCRSSQAMVQGIITSQGIPIVYGECMRSTLKFTPFNHATSSRAEHYFYVINVNKAGSIRIQQMKQWKQCMAVQRRQQEAGRSSYCASSTQRLLTKGSQNSLTPLE